jgi:hypothetical protein
MQIISSGCRVCSGAGSSSPCRSLESDTKPGGPSSGWPQSVSRRATSGKRCRRAARRCLARVLLPTRFDPHTSARGATVGESHTAAMVCNAARLHVTNCVWRPQPGSSHGLGACKAVQKWASYEDQ